MRRLLSSNLAAAAAIALAAFVLAGAAREAGFFERADLALHDSLVRASYETAKPEDRFVIVLESEADLRRWKYPLSDEILADLIARVLEANPAVLAIDKYRDAPVEPGRQRLEQVLRGSDRVYWVRKFGTRPGDDIPAPAVLDSRFVGCNDLVDDRDGNVRRALLYLDDGKQTCYSLGLQMANHVANRKAVAFAFPREDPDHFVLGKARIRALDASDGPYVRADAAGFQIAFPSAARAAFQTVGLSDVLDGKVPAERLRDKVVLFGSGAQSLGDFFNVPSKAAEGYEKVNGVEMHALVASYLLLAASGSAVPIQLAPRGVALALAAVFAFGAGFVACARRRLPMTLAGLALVAFLLGLAAYGLARNGIFTGITAAAVAVSIAFVAGIARSEWLERRERAELMSLFGRHVSPEVAEDLWRRRDEFARHGAIKPRQVVATILFLDIRGFTTVSEKLAPDVIVGWLNRGLTVMIGEIMGHKGVVTRFAGDAIMAIFGAPVPRTNEAEMAADAANAIEAGLGIGPALDRLNAAFEKEGLPRIRVRVGINTGSVTQCSVGARDRMEFTVLGDPTNVASRLESYSMEDRGETARVLVGEETFRLAGERFETTLVGSIALKGKEQPVTLRQVLSKR